MFYLPPLSQENIEEYYGWLKKRLLAAKTAAALLSQPVRRYLAEPILKQIIEAKPADMLQYHDSIIPLLSPNSSLVEYNDSLVAKNKFPDQRSVAEQALVDKYELLLTPLHAVFNYDLFIAKHKITSYDLAAMLDRSTCTYCNRLYTTTVVHIDEATGRVNNDTRLIRPTFDHWYAKSKYPVLALSIHNLIPSCSICNSFLKSATDFNLGDYIHPYDTTPQPDFTFDYIHEAIHKSNVVLQVEDDTSIARTLKAFRIEEIYDAHSAFELKDLLELRYKYPEDYLSTLFNDTFKLAVGEKEAYRMIFGVEYDEEHHHRRPFSKFKKDILCRLGISI